MSSYQPIVALRICSVRSTKKSDQSPVTASRMIANQIIIGIGPMKPRASFNSGCSWLSSSSFRPKVESRRTTSDSVRPSSPVLQRSPIRSIPM